MQPAKSSLPPELTREHVASFERDGAVCIRGLLTQELIHLLRTGVDANLRHPSPRAKIASRPDDPGRFIEDFRCWQENEYYRRLIFESPLGPVAAALMQSKTARLYHDHMLTKEPGTFQRTPWHQDQPYYNIEGRMNCSFWIAVDSVKRDATLEFVAGSHTGPWLMPRSFMTEEARWFPEGTLTDLPDIESAREQYPIIGWGVEPGDVVCFHMLTLHGAPGVAGAGRRRVFSVRFIGDDVTHAPRRWVTSPEFPGLTDSLPAGAPMDHPMFPIVWRAEVEKQ